MAKNRKGGKVEIEVTDGGSLNKLGKNAKNASKDVSSVAKSTAESDRRLKSLSNQTSNTTKGFSKQAQTIQGGLVPVYATLAAQVFAVSAAFRFLENAVDFSNLVAGQEAFASVTGTAFRSITSAVRAATKGQLDFAQASSAVAIGTASGLGTGQLQALATAAKDVSLALGRPLEDSFNRLIRGVTKAEPELLDELGIVLRLDPALRAYATSVNKTVAQLTPFERTQAVTNEVLEQAQSKFALVSQELDDSAFAFNQFKVAFMDLFDNFREGLGNVAKFVLPFFTKNVSALIGVLTLFAIPIVQAIIPSMDGFVKSSQKTTRALKIQTAALKQQNIQLQVAAGGLVGDPTAIAKTRAAGMKAIEGAGFKPKGETGEFTNRQLAAIRRNTIENTKFIKNNSKKQVQIMKTAFAQIDAAALASAGKQKVAQAGITSFIKIQVNRVRMMWSSTYAFLVRGARVAARGINLAFRAAGIIAILTLLFDLGRTAFEFFFPPEVNERADKFKEEIKSIVDNAKDLNNELDSMQKKFMEGRITDVATFRGNLIQSASIQTRLTQLDALGLKAATVEESEQAAALEQVGQVREQLIDSTRTLAAVTTGELSASYKELIEILTNTGTPTEEFIKRLRTQESLAVSIAFAIKNASNETKQFQQQLKAATGVSLPGAQFLNFARTRGGEGGSLQLRHFGALENFNEALRTGTEKQINDAAEVVRQVEREIEENERVIELLEAQQELHLEKLLLQTKNNVEIQKGLKSENALVRIQTQANQTTIQQRTKVLDLEHQIRHNVKLHTEMNDADKVQQEEIIKNLMQRLALERELLDVIVKRAPVEEKLALLSLGQQVFRQAGKNMGLAVQAQQGQIAADNRAFAGTQGLRIAQQEATKQFELNQLNARKENLNLLEKEMELKIKAGDIDALNGQLKLDEIELNKTLNEQKTKEIEQRNTALSIGQAGLAAGAQTFEQQTGRAIVTGFKEQKDPEEVILGLASAVIESVVVAIINQLVAQLVASFVTVTAIQVPALTGALAAGGLVAGAEMAAAITAAGGIAAAQMFAAIVAASVVGVSRGGVIPMAGGGITSMRYGLGGIAKEPTYMVGEAGPEAVVPLPDGRTIPVTMEGGMGGNITNNVSIQIDDSGNAFTDVDSSSRLAESIQAAITDTIIKEQAYGGLLSKP